MSLLGKRRDEMSKREREGVTRRAFLKGSVTAGAAAAAAVTVSGESIAATESAKESPKAKGYRATAHIRAYYKSARS